jgi:hypothetical protein
LQLYTTTEFISIYHSPIKQTTSPEKRPHLKNYTESPDIQTGNGLQKHQPLMINASQIFTNQKSLIQHTPPQATLAETALI